MVPGHSLCSGARKDVSYLASVFIYLGPCILLVYCKACKAVSVYSFNWTSLFVGQEYRVGLLLQFGSRHCGK